MTSGAKKLIVTLASANLALLAGSLLLLTRARTQLPGTQAALADPEFRAEMVRRLSATSAGIWDTHNDPEVGRVIQPGLTEADFMGHPTRTNALGLREKEIALPKPAGLVRIVLLGDSYVHGFGVAAEERVGVFLERYLRQRARGWSGELECLHVGVGGWNAIAECAYLRRSLSDLAPDLVLHVLIGNDTEDQMGTRGFGGLAAFAPLARHRADARVYCQFPVQYSTTRATNFLLEAADFESRHRYEAMAGAIARVVPLLRSSGARYVAVSHWGNFYNARAWQALKGVLEPREFATLPQRLFGEPELVQSATDLHWSVAGHELVARLLFTVIRVRGLLPELALEPWPEVEEPAQAELARAWRDTVHPPKWANQPPADGRTSLEPARFGEHEWRHVYTGLDGQGQVSPFASFYLERRGQAALVVRGRALDRPELAGARVRASVEAVAVGEHELVPGQPFELRAPLPKGIERRGGVTVRLETSDHVYAGSDRQHCISFVLERLALE